MKKLQMNKMDKINNKLSKILLIIFIAFFVILLFIGGFTFISMMPVDSNNEEKINFVIQKGWGKSQIIDELKNKKLIRNALLFKVYVKVTNPGIFYPGTYVLSPSMNADEIISIINSGNSLENEEVSVTFVEGKGFPYFVSKMSENFGFKESDIYSITSDQVYLKELIDKYWFLSTDILNKDIYYPLEGYLFPNTYTFKKVASIKDVIETLLKGMDEKLSVYREEIETSEYSIHSLLTLASMVELEAVTAEDRLSVSRVFLSRLEKNIPLGSDVTTYYAFKREMTQSINDVLDKCNAYNTRGVCAIAGLPVGPICASSYSSITAAINPEDNDYLFFVADKNNKLYFSKTNEEQLRVISDLKQKNLWPEV